MTVCTWPHGLSSRNKVRDSFSLYIYSSPPRDRIFIMRFDPKHLFFKVPPKILLE